MDVDIDIEQFYKKYIRNNLQTYQQMFLKDENIVKNIKENFMSKEKIIYNYI